jgi:hypothetical protein
VFEYFFTSPTADDEKDKDPHQDVIEVADDHSFVESGVTSGADPSDWEPIRIEKQDGKDDDEDEDVVKTDLTTDSQPAGVTSGSDAVDDNVKSSHRKTKPPK